MPNYFVTGVGMTVIKTTQDFLDSIETLPINVEPHMEAIRMLDIDTEALQKQIEISTEPKQLYKEALEKCKKKVELADKCHALVTQQIRKMDSELVAFERELQEYKISEKNSSWKPKETYISIIEKMANDVIEFAGDEEDEGDEYDQTGLFGFHC